MTLLAKFAILYAIVLVSIGAGLLIDLELGL